jgi:formylglycine-generating enzyme required for sulfatase activity
MTRRIGGQHLALVFLLGFMAFEVRPAELPDRAAVIAAIKLVDIAAGKFVMGTDAKPGEQQGFPPHAVMVRPFALSTTLITFDQYDAFAKATHRLRAQDEGWGRGDRPVINVNREEMLAFIQWLNRGNHRHYRLPSEAEYEYAARAGTTTPYFWGDAPITDYANTVANTGRDIYVYTSPVGSFLPNPWGLFDIIGNVWQMTQDCRHADFVGAPVDGGAWMGEPCDSYIVRGGWYRSVKRGVQVTSRSAASASFRSTGLGFRVAADPVHTH